MMEKRYPATDAAFLPPNPLPFGFAQDEGELKHLDLNIIPIFKISLKNDFP
jgi:hypothetical protein